MSAHTTFKIGGPAEAFVRPSDPESASGLLAAAKKAGIPLFVLGGGANILVGDKGIRGIVMETSGLNSARVERGEGRDILVAGAGLSIDELCLGALAAGLGGLENFYGMPGTVGGAAFMNARCYEREMSDVLAWVDSTDAQGRITRRPVAPSGAVAATGAAATGDAWAYKRSPYQSGATGVESGEAAGELILEAGFRLTRLTDEGAASAAAVMRRRRADREAKGHYKLPSAGSVFKNDRSLGVPTGKLLDSLGLRGRRIGAAMVSPWHANIFVNEGGATAADMRKLIELAQREALERLGAKLECEVLMAGDF